MSNSIWKKPDQKPERNEDILVEYTSTNGLSYYIVDSYLNELLHPKRWAYLTDIIAQADKAKRLQKAVDDSREKLAAFMHDVWGNWFAYQLNNSTVENLQRWGIQSNTSYSSLTETDKDKDRKFADKIIEIIKDEIKQLIKETQ